MNYSDLTFNEVLNSYEYKQISKIIADNKRISDRIESLEIAGFNVLPYKKAMGSGGVGQIKVCLAKDRRCECAYIQISCGEGRYNYAYVVFLPFRNRIN